MSLEVTMNSSPKLMLDNSVVQLVSSPLSVISVQRAIARLLPIFYSTESHYKTILIGATSHKRGRL